MTKTCQKYDWFYVNNRTLGGKHLYKDGLHLMEEDTTILTRNVILGLNMAIFYIIIF